MQAITCCTDCIIIACNICIPANGFRAGLLDDYEPEGRSASGVDGGGIDVGGGVVISMFFLAGRSET